VCRAYSGSRKCRGVNLSLRVQGNTIRSAARRNLQPQYHFASCWYFPASICRRTAHIIPRFVLSLLSVGGGSYIAHLPPPCTCIRAELAIHCSQMFATGGVFLFIASAKMAIDPEAAKVSTRQMKDMQDIIKHQIKTQIKTSMKNNIQLQKKDVKTRESDTHEVHSLERQVRDCQQCATCPQCATCLQCAECLQCAARLAGCWLRETG